MTSKQQILIENKVRKIVKKVMSEGNQPFTDYGKSFIAVTKDIIYKEKPAKVDVDFTTLNGGGFRVGLVINHSKNIFTVEVDAQGKIHVKEN